MAKVHYTAAPGAPFTSKDAPKIGAYLERMERRGPITPSAIVEDAAVESSPLHRYFEWDDDEAARKYRLQQARLLVNHLMIVVKDADGESLCKGFHSIKIVQSDDEEAGRAYASMETVQNNERLRYQVLETARRELQYWRMRYGQYQELWEVTSVIDETVGGSIGAAARSTNRKRRAKQTA